MTFVMSAAKQKVTVPAMVGWNLLEAAQHHGLLTHCTPGDDPWDYTTFGEGPSSCEDHVIISRAYFDKMGPAGWQEKQLIRNELASDGKATPT